MAIRICGIKSLDKVPMGRGYLDVEIADIVNEDDFFEVEEEKKILEFVSK
jgi:hypothetical protein